jgi:hypothetical protein
VITTASRISGLSRLKLLCFGGHPVIIFRWYILLLDIGFDHFIRDRARRGTDLPLDDHNLPGHTGLADQITCFRPVELGFFELHETPPGSPRPEK